MTFSLGSKCWRFAAPDGYVGPESLASRSAAAAAFEGYCVKLSEQR